MVLICRVWPDANILVSAKDLEKFVRRMMLAGATNDSESRGALTGLRVLDLTARKGGYCGLLLAHLGAAVILMEAPGRGPMRSQGPLQYDGPHLDGSLSLAAYHTDNRG